MVPASTGAGSVSMCNYDSNVEVPCVHGQSVLQELPVCVRPMMSQEEQWLTRRRANTENGYS